MSNLNEAQFQDAINVEEQQRRRFRRKHESGYVGNGYWWANYPYMYGTMGTGGMMTTATEPQKQEGLDNDSGQTANLVDGMGVGGTAASASGAAGGMPA